MIKYKETTPADVYQYNDISQKKNVLENILETINFDGYLIIDFRPAQIGEYYFDSISCYVERWEVKPNDDKPRFIVVPKSFLWKNLSTLQFDLLTLEYIKAVKKHILDETH